jgi:tetratricopeptide (TPR) repeat protein
MASADAEPTAEPAAAAQALLEEGRALLAQGSVRAGCAKVHLAAERLPQWWVAQLEYVQCGRLAGEPPQTLLAHIDRGIAAEPDKAALHFERGVVFEDMGETDEAVSAYQRTVELAPWRMDARLRLGEIAARAGRWDEALEVYRAWASQEPANVFARRKLAEGYEATGQMLLAARELELVARWSGYPAAVLARLAMLYGELGMSEDRARVLRELSRYR